MSEKKNRKAPFPQSRKKIYKQHQSGADNKEWSPCHYHELNWGCDIFISCNIKKVLLKIHTNPDVFSSRNIVGYNMKKFMHRNAYYRQNNHPDGRVKKNMSYREVSCNFYPYIYCKTQENETKKPVKKHKN